MRDVRSTILLGLMALCLLAGLSIAEDEPSGPDAKAAPERVIIRADRNNEIAGFVELEDADSIVIRTLHGEVKSFAKVRVTSVIRLVDPKPGQKGVAVLRGGGGREGIVIADTFENVVLEIEGVRTTIPREAVDYVVLRPTFEEQYMRFKSALEPSMYDGRVELARWLIDERRFEMARDELKDILASVEMAEARRLLRVAEAQIALITGTQSPVADPPESTDDGDAPLESDPMGRVQSDGPTRVLSREEVNLIRVYEIDFDDPPRVIISPDTIDKLIAEHSTNPNIPESRDERLAMYRADPLDLVKLMFSLRARDLYREIQVLSEPRALNVFRQRVHNAWLMNNCATSRCHGGPDAGALWLHRRGYKDARVRYTNLLILDRLAVDAKWPLINYDEPQMSLIIQYGLPRTEARLPHPDVKGWRPAFRPGNRRVLDESLRWINLMMKPRPEYPVNLDPNPPTSGLEPLAPTSTEREPR